MKPVTFLELESVVDVANGLAGAFLEDIVFSKGLLYLGLQSEKEKGWFVFDLQSARPGFFITFDRPPLVRPEIKPIVLFLKARKMGMVFNKAERLKNFGRAVILHFTDAEGVPLQMEAHLFPQNKNFLIRHQKSQLSLHKPKELTPIEEKNMTEEVRSAPQLYKEWRMDLEGSKSPAKASSAVLDLQKEIDKKTKGLQKLKESMAEMEQNPWRQTADLLRAQGELEVPDELKKYVDKKLSLEENIDRCYSQSKQQKAKLVGAQERVEKLEAEIERLKSGEVPAKGVGKKRASLLQEAKGRTKVFSPEISAYIGKSAADNLKLLRNAKAWYIWVHAKDIPSSHGIIALPKNKTLPAHILREVALWVLKESITPKQWDDWKGLKSEFIYCECRFVTPIKGDKIGRVRYKNEKALNLTV